MDNKEEIVLNSEDEDYSDLPACGSSGDPAHKVKDPKKKKEVSCASKDSSTIAKDSGCKDCDCDEGEEKKVEEDEDIKKGKKMCYKCKEEVAQYKYRQDFACKKCLESNLDHKFKVIT